jgi:hypothetical protein
VTLTTSPTPTAERQVLTALARIHARRFLRHPLYLLGVLLLASGLVQAYRSPDSAGVHWDEIGLSTSMFLGIPGLIVAYRLTVTEEKAIAVLPSAPSDQRVRTLALCLACLVPAVTIAVFFVLYAVVNQLSPGGLEDPYSLRPADGTIGWAGYVAHLAEVVVAGLGGPLLGVVTARWLRFAGAGILVAVGLFLVEMTALALGEGGTSFWDAWWVQAFTDLMPWVYWGADSNGDRLYESMRPGSPVGHLVYSLALCGLAVTAAVLKDATPGVKATWTRRGWVLLGVAAVGCLWALLG